MAELRTLPYDCDGLKMLGQVARPPGPGPHPGVLVMHDARGLGDLVKEKTVALADLGYVAVASDMYGGGLFHHGEKMLDLQKDPNLLRRRIFAGFEALKAQQDVDPNRVGAVGYCFGGQTVIELARAGADVKSVVSFHGVLTTKMPAKKGEVRAQVLAITGLHDPYAPHDDVEAFRQEMLEADVDWQLTIYGQGWHQFTDPSASVTMPDIPGLKYDPLLDRLSWAAALAMFEATLG